MAAAAAVRPLRWLLDTNIISGPVRRQADPRVLKTLLKHHAELALPVTVVQQLTFGWLRLPEGRNKRHVGNYLHTAVSRLPVLDLDLAAAPVQADLRAQAERLGRPIAIAHAPDAGNP